MPTIFADNFNPFASFRKKTQSLRIKHRRQSIVFTDISTNKQQMTSTMTPKLRKKPIIDPNYTIDGFLSRLGRRLSTKIVEKKDDSEPALRSIRQLNRIHSYKNFVQMMSTSTKCVLDILQYLSPSDIRNLRLVNHEFNEIIQKHSLQLPKQEIYSMDIYENEYGKLGRRIFASDDLIHPMRLETIDKPLRHIHCKNINFYNVVITGKTVKYLHRSVKYELFNVKFYNCKFQLRSNDFLLFIKHWNLSSLEIHQCTWEPSEDIVDGIEDSNYFITDKFFSINNNIKFTCFDFTQQNEQQLCLTDKFSQIFTRKNLNLPWTLIMNNSVSFITAKTIFAAVSGYVDAALSTTSHRTPIFYCWTLGRCLDSRDMILQSILPYMEYCIIDNSTVDMIDLIFQVRPNYPALYFIVYLTKALHSENDLDTYDNSTVYSTDFELVDDTDSEDDIDFDDEDED